MKRKLKLSTLKKQAQAEEKAFEQLKKVYPQFKGFTESEILDFLELEKRDEIVGYKLTSVVSTLMPEESESICRCTDAKGNDKSLYTTYDEAKEKSLFFEKEQQIRLKVYACPTCNGWHLSKM